jgi:DNA-binding SARP family transcriptional activator/tetratricopeptide (TPR) repeat protein
MLRIVVLGRLSLEQNERPLAGPVGRPARLLLGWLALHPGAHSRAAVAAELWPDVLDESARGSLRVALVDLRRTLAGTAERVLLATRDQIGLIDTPELEVDARRFIELLDTGMTREALALWRGQPLDGLDGGDWLVALRDEYRDRRSRALTALADQATERGEADEAVRLARERVSSDPFSEDATRELMRRLMAAGDRAAALLAYDRLAERLRSELRTAPSTPTRALAEALRDSEPDQPDLPLETVAESWPPATVGVSPRRSAFVGRDPELELLLRCARQRRRLALISGDPGTGKTRLIFELGEVASSEGVSVLYGRCQQEPLAPYEPFVQALREHVARVGAAAVAPLAGEELARLLPELRIAQPRQPAGELAEAARLRLFEGIRATLEHAARHQPVMLVLDDLHWADSSTVALLAHLARAKINGPVTFIGAYRPGDVTRDQPLIGTLAELEREREAATIALGGLNRAATASIIEGLIKREPDESLVEHVLQQTLGNAFFVEQLAGHLRDAGALVDRDDRAVLGISAAGAPAGVRGLVRGRVQRLGESAGQALELAAVLGAEFSLALLRSTGEIEQGSLLDGLEAAEAAGLIVAVPDQPGRWMFKHALVRAALYEQLTDLRRGRLHSSITDALERLGGDPAELAYHAFAARGIDGPQRAVRTSRLAAQEALSELAYEEAAGHWQHALQALEQDTGADRRERCELMLALGEAQSRAGDPAVEHTFLAAERRARDLADPALIAQAVLGRCGVGVTIVGLDAARVRALQDALELLGDDSHALRARILARLAIELYYAPDRTRADPLSAKAIKAARRAEDPDALLIALSSRHVALWTPDGLDDRLAVAEEMITLARRHGRPEHELQGRNWLCADLWEAGQIERFETEAQAHARLATRLRLPTYTWYEPLWQASVAALRAEWDRAERLISQAEQTGTDAGDRNAPLFAWGLRLAMRLARHEFAQEDLENAERHIRDSPASPAWRCLRCWFAANAGQLKQANEDLDWLAGDGFAALPRDANWLPAMFELTEAVCLLGDRLRASDMYDLLRPYGDRHISAMRGTISWGSGETLLGRLASTGGNLDQAAHHFEAALDLERGWGARAWLVRTGVGYAALLVERGGPGDRERARDLARETVAQAKALQVSPTAVPSTVRELGEARLQPP